MVTLDHQLVFMARRLLNGANVHLLKELIFAYEQAVLLHNSGWPTHFVYDAHPERKLRLYVFQQRMVELDRRLSASKEYAARVIAENKRREEKVAFTDALLARGTSAA